MNLGVYHVKSLRHDKPLHAYDYHVTGRPENWDELIVLMRSFGHTWYYCGRVGPKKYLLDHYDRWRGRRGIDVVDYGHREAIQRTIFSFRTDFTNGIKGQITLRRDLFNADVTEIVRKKLYELIIKRKELEKS